MTMTMLRRRTRRRGEGSSSPVSFEIAVPLPLLLLLLLGRQVSSSSSSSLPPPPSDISNKKKIVVVGSANVDTFLPVRRLPSSGENVGLWPPDTAEPVVDVPGGKGCTQAVAAAKLLLNSDKSNDEVVFVGQFGSSDEDAAAVAILKRALAEVGVDAVSYCGTHAGLRCGRGYVFVAKESGEVCAVVSGGANLRGWDDWREAWDECQSWSRRKEEGERSGDPPALLEGLLEELVQGCSCILLQREVPEYVNLLIGWYVAQKKESSLVSPIVIQDVGGEDRPITPLMLSYSDYLVPNETELHRLVRTFERGIENLVKDDEDDTATIVSMVNILQKHGARNVLVTRGSKGSVLVTESGKHVICEPAKRLASQVVDETGAGDCFRAAFAVAIAERGSSLTPPSLSLDILRMCMKFASAAGACSVERSGAVPSTPSRQMVDDRCSGSVSDHGRAHNESELQSAHDPTADSVLNIPRGDGLLRSDGLPRDAKEFYRDESDSFPFLIGSRLNSMKDRPELWSGPLETPKDYMKRQATVQGLTCVDFNYPQHFHSWTVEEAKAALDEHRLRAGAVCLRFPSKFARGAMNHPDLALRREAIELIKQAAAAAHVLHCHEVVIWSAFDGYDYNFQVDYETKWCELVDAFRECCDAFPNLKFSLEYKPTDENTRWFTVPSTGAAVLLMHEVDRANFGLTLDVGHMLMAGENPGQSIAMVGRSGKLFGIQLNDGFTRLAAEDGLMFGSVHPSVALEIMYQLRRIGFNGHFYFDTFPQRTDPVKEAEYNIRRVKAFWNAAGSIDESRLLNIVRDHDAIGALELVEDILRGT